MAVSGAERVRKHRLRKKADDFSKKYMDGVNIATPEDFMEAKLYEEQTKTMAHVVGFNASFTNCFYERLKDCDEEDGLYIIDDLFECWEEAEKEVELDS